MLTSSEVVPAASPSPGADKSSESWFRDVLSLLPMSDIPHEVIATAWKSFVNVPLGPFQHFHVWAAQHGLDNPFGLDWEALRHFDPAR